MADRLRDKVALVWGAGSGGPGWGNGKATAVAYAREGARVMAVDIDADAARETVDIITGEGFDATAQTADVADSDSVRRAVAHCRETLGRIDILHNNVGIVGIGGPLDIDEAEWDRIMRVNATSMFLTCKHTLPLFLDQGGGAIVNVSSLSGTKAIRPEVAYAASKGSPSTSPWNSPTAPSAATPSSPASSKRPWWHGPSPMPMGRAASTR